MYHTELSVRFNDCDALGHVNNAVYLTFFEEARKELFRVFTPDLDVSRWNLILASTHCDFLKQVMYAENLTIYTWISRLGASSFDCEQGMQDANGNWVARGKATLIRYEFGTEKAVPLTEEMRQALLQHTEGPSDAPPMRG